MVAREGTIRILLDKNKHPWRRGRNDGFPDVALAEKADRSPGGKGDFQNAGITRIKPVTLRKGCAFNKRIQMYAEESDSRTSDLLGFFHFETRRLYSCDILTIHARVSSKRLVYTDDYFWFV